MKLLKKALLFIAILFFLPSAILFSLSSSSNDLFVEAESFREKGGWVVDQQFTDLMGSSYLMAHGLGKPVKDAKTTVSFPKTGAYNVFVRTYNWSSPWSSKGAGIFSLSVNGTKLPIVLGDLGKKWMWQKAGMIDVTEKTQKIALHDLTGFNGRCDAIYFTMGDELPPDDPAKLSKFRKEKTKKDRIVQKSENVDLVVVGGGIAGMCAATSAARLGLKVALINDRPVLGGNNSSEIRVHLGGRIDLKPYPNLGNLIKEFGPEREGNAQPAEYYEDNKKQHFIDAEDNISLFSSYRVFDVKKQGNKIVSVTAKHIETNNEIVFYAPLFADCTGDGTVGYLAGAEFLMGREGKEAYQEPLAPETGDKMTMGASVQWYSVEKDSPQKFPPFNYGVKFNKENAEYVTMGEWTWETGMNYDQITDFERIRDYGLMVVFSNWSFLKNEYEDEDNSYKNRQLEWVAYIAGKRESRRLIGDYVLTENDLVNHIVYDDATASTSWSIDLHYPDKENSKFFPGEEFKSIAVHKPIHFYPVPYRCLYSGNINNLFMAGRHISVTHVALGTTRVMRTTGMLGEVVGMAASICRKNNASPRDVYLKHLNELKALMEKGTGKQLPNNQQYNVGSTLGYKAGENEK